MSQPIHILFINEFFHPDICASAVVAADHLPKVAALRPDWRISIITGNRAWDDPSKRYAADDSFQDVQVIRVNRPAVSRRSLLWRGLGFAAFERASIRAASRLGAINLVVGTTAPPQGGRITAKIARRAGCPYIYTVLDLYPDTAVTLGKLKGGSLVHRQWQRMDTRVMVDSAAVVAISTPITQRIARMRAVSRDRLHTIHDGYDASRLTFDGPNHFAQQYNPGGKFVVQYAGNMGLSHPLDTILGAARRLESRDDILFQFIGDGPQRASLRKRLPRNAALIDYQPADRLGQVLASADVCLISQHEAMYDQALPYKIYAILAAAKPCIFVGSEHSEIAQWLTDSAAGVVIRHGEEEKLEDTIRSIRDDAPRGRAMGMAARRLFEERFNSSKSARAWVDLIDTHLA